MYGYVAYIRYKFRAKHERMSNNSLTNCAKRRDMGFFLVPRKVRFLAMTMFEQARRCSFDLMKTFFPRSWKSAFSRHDNVQSSSTSLIWPNENVRWDRSLPYKPY